MVKSVVVTTENHQNLRKVNILGAGVPDTSLPNWTSVGDNEHNTFETVVATAGTTPGLATVVVPNYSTGPDVTAPTITSSNSANNVENTVLAHALTANESVTWSISGGADAGKFSVAGNILRWLANGTKNYEAPDDADANNQYVVQVRATDASNNTADQTVTVTVTDVDEIAPTITSASTANNAENSVLSHTLTADESVTWAIVGGADAARFEISGSTLRWAADGVKDFEAPDDADTNNAYTVQVRATDTASNQTDQTITVTVTDVAEGGGGGDVVTYDAEAITYDSEDITYVGG